MKFLCFQSKKGRIRRIPIIENENKKLRIRFLNWTWIRTLGETKCFDSLRVFSQSKILFHRLEKDGKKLYIWRL